MAGRSALFFKIEADQAIYKVHYVFAKSVVASGLNSAVFDLGAYLFNVPILASTLKFNSLAYALSLTTFSFDAVIPPAIPVFHVMKDTSVNLKEHILSKSRKSIKSVA